MMATQSMLFSGSRGLRASPSLNSTCSAFALRPLLGEPHEVARAVEPHHVLEAAPGELEAVPTLAAAQVEDVAIAAASAAAETMKSTSRRVFSKFSTTSPSVFT